MTRDNLAISLMKNVIKDYGIINKNNKNASFALGYLRALKDLETIDIFDFIAFSIQIKRKYEK